MPVIGEAWLDVEPTPGSEQQFSDRVQSTARKAALAAGAILGAQKLFQFGKESLLEFYEADKITTQLTSRVQALGQEAGVTVSGVQNMAVELMNLAGIADDTTESAATLLLTFTNVRNEVGKNNNIFDRALVGLGDMSLVMGTDMVQSSIALGKALNDPTVGITALRRVGVSFTAEQRKMIKEMATAGDVMGAQKIILKELNKEFGGAAAAVGESEAGKAAILTANVNELKESFGAFLSEGINPVVEGLTTYAQMANEAGRAGTSMAENVAASTRQMESWAQAVVNGTMTQGEFEAQMGRVIAGLDDQTLGLEGTVTAYSRAMELVNANAQGHEVLADALQRDTDETNENVLARKEQREANEAAAQSIRDLLTEELKAAGGLIGAIAASRQARDARRELRAATEALSAAEAKHGEDSKEAREARRDFTDLTFESIEAHAGLEGAIVSYGQSLADTGMSQGEAIAKVKEFGRQAGASQPIIQGAIDKVKGLAEGLDVIPERVKTTVSVDTTDAEAALNRLIRMANQLSEDPLQANAPPPPGPRRGGRTGDRDRDGIPNSLDAAKDDTVKGIRIHNNLHINGRVIQSENERDRILLLGGAL